METVEVAGVCRLVLFVAGQVDPRGLLDAGELRPWGPLVMGPRKDHRAAECHQLPQVFDHSGVEGNPLIPLPLGVARPGKGEITIDQAAVELRDLMEVRSFGQLRCKVSEKGAVSVYGLQKQWPVTLYADQWERLFAVADEIKTFIQEHAAELKRKQRS